MGPNSGIEMAWVSMAMTDVPIPMAINALMRGRTAHRTERRKAKNKITSANRTPSPSLEL
jgi:hypothetical protein